MTSMAPPKAWDEFCLCQEKLEVPCELGDDWIYQIKGDGIRCAYVHGRLWSRGGHDVTDLFPEIARAMPLRFREAWVDGEILHRGPNSSHDFSEVRRRIALRDPIRVAVAAQENPCTFYTFDCLRDLDGVDVRDRPLIERIDCLEDGDIPRWQDFDAAWDQVETYGFEGLVAKRKDSTYAAGRTQAWRKMKPGQAT